jgi:hypothetical protein
VRATSMGLTSEGRAAIAGTVAAGVPAPATHFPYSTSPPRPDHGDYGASVTGPTVMQ